MDDEVKGIIIGSIIGAGAGFVFSAFFLFPDDVLNLKIIEMTVGDMLRILGGLVLIVIGGGLGGIVGSWYRN